MFLTNLHRWLHRTAPNTPRQARKGKAKAAQRTRLQRERLARKFRAWLLVERLEDRQTPSAIPVTTFADGGAGSGSLRAAILQADTNADAAPTISLAAGTYTLDLSASDGATP